jgi:4-hydroxyphenylpyruvate dioxygenase
MQTAIATVSLPGTLDEKLAAIAGAKFRGVEIFENDLLSFNGTPAEARRLVEDLGLRTITFQPFRDFEGMPGPQRDRNFSRAERKFDLMQELGCDLLLVCSNVSPDAIGGIDRAADDFHQLGERAAKRGLRVAFEALAWGRHINDYRDSWEVVRRADHPSIGLVLDSFHILVRGTDPKDRIFLVQIADAPRLDMDYLSWSRHYRCFPGQGDLAIDQFMAALQATGFDGLISLEIFSDRFRAGSARGVAIDGQRSLLFMLDNLRRATGAALPGIKPLPPASAVDGIEFLEFAMDDASRSVRNRPRRPWVRPCRHSQIERCGPLAAGRDQSRRQPREGGVCSFLQYRAWAVGVRDRVARQRCRRRGQARRAAARSAVPPGGRAGRTQHPGGAGSGRQSALFCRWQDRVGPAVGCGF